MVSADISDMAERMLAADLAIGAGGTTSWERCCLGLPTLMISLAENQALIASEVEKAGASINLGSMDDLTVKSVKSSLQMLNDNGDLMRDLASKGFQLVDGVGTKRVTERMDSRL
jgi:spore coat polysaccharide biosynthesis predicted glycosyltransferase SpsG